MQREEKKEAKPLTVNDLINRLEDLAANHGCGNLEVRMLPRELEYNSLKVRRVFRCADWDGDFIGIM